MKKLLFILFLVLPAGAAYSQDMTKHTVDSLLVGSWMLKDPTQAKVFTSSGEPFLRVVINFGDRRRFSVERETHVWEWEYTAKGQKLTLADMEMEVAMDYVIKSISKDELIIMIGKQEFIFKRINH